MSNSQSSSEASPAPVRKLYRSSQQRIIGGVCGGLAEYFNVDAILVRLLWILITLIGGAGILAYIIGWIVIPIRPGQGEPQPRGTGSAGTVIGLILVIIGAIMLASWSSVCAFAFPMGMHWFALPGILIVLGLGLLVGWLLNRTRQDARPASMDSAPESATRSGSSARLYRSRDQRVLSGICGGLGKYFNLDPTIVRILWVLFAVASLGTALLIYVILIFVIPEEPVI